MSSIPYQPMWKRKEVSFERMQEILSKHKPSIRWKRVATDAMESTDGYRVIKEAVHPTGWRYMAFHRAPYGPGRCIGRYDSFAAAQLGCDTHRKSALGAAVARAGTSEATPLAEEGSGENSGSV